jgi:anti-sigma-K factor RskA
MTHEPFAEWSALYAVGVLDGDERARFEAHLGGCVTCEGSLRELSAAATALAFALPALPPPPGLRDRVLARVTADARVQPASFEPRLSGFERRRAAWPWAGGWRWAGGLLAAGLVAALVWQLLDIRGALDQQRAQVDRAAADLARQGQELAQQREITALVSHKDTRAVTLRGVGIAAPASGWIVWSPEKRRGWVVVHFLPSVPAGKQYQLWTIAGNQALPAGVFDVDDVGHAALTVEVATARPDLFIVTLEPRGGATAPSRPFLMEGGV